MGELDKILRYGSTAVGHCALRWLLRPLGRVSLYLLVSQLDEFPQGIYFGKNGLVLAPLSSSPLFTKLV